MQHALTSPRTPRCSQLCEMRTESTNILALGCPRSTGAAGSLGKPPCLSAAAMMGMEGQASMISWVAVKELKVTILGKPYYLRYIPIMVT